MPALAARLQQLRRRVRLRLVPAPRGAQRRLCVRLPRPAPVPVLHVDHVEALQEVLVVDHLQACRRVVVPRRVGDERLELLRRHRRVQ